MKILIIKTSSLGDVVHTLIAVNDLYKAMPHVEIDWLVEKNFEAIPGLHPAVNKVIPIAFRQHRKQFIASWKKGYWQSVIKEIRSETYDVVLDAQGLIKSGLFTLLARGKRVGLDRCSAREPLSSLCYQEKMAVPKGKHAVYRLRELFSKAFSYEFDAASLDYGIGFSNQSKATEKKLLFLHGTTWSSKCWPIEYWCMLAKKANDAGYEVTLPWGNAEEKQRAEMIAVGCDNTIVLPKLALNEIINEIQKSSGVVSVDTGLGHLVAGFGIPCVSIYGATNPALTGTVGERQQHLTSTFQCAPCLKRQCKFVGQSTVVPACYEELDPSIAWESLKRVIE